MPAKYIRAAARIIAASNHAGALPFTGETGGAADGHITVPVAKSPSPEPVSPLGKRQSDVVASRYFFLPALIGTGPELVGTPPLARPPPAAAIEPMAGDMP